MDNSLIIERIKEQCAAKGISVNKALLESGLSKSIVDNLKKGSAPSIDKMAVLADYLNCSVDYLLGRTPAPNVTEPEQRIEAYDLMPGYGYSDLDDEDKAFVEQQQKLLVEQLLKKKGKK